MTKWTCTVYNLPLRVTRHLDAHSWITTWLQSPGYPGGISLQLARAEEHLWQRQAAPDASTLLG